MVAKVDVILITICWVANPFFSILIQYSFKDFILQISLGMLGITILDTFDGSLCFFELLDNNYL